MLAFQPEDRLAAILGHVELAERGPNTITDEATLRAELATIRTTGIAVNDEELARTAPTTSASNEAPTDAPLTGTIRALDRGERAALVKGAYSYSLVGASTMRDRWYFDRIAANGMRLRAI